MDRKGPHHYNQENGKNMRIHVKVVPGSTKDEIVGPHGDGLKVRVTEAPEKGKANAAVIRLLAGHFGVKPAQVRIVSGAGSPHKVIEIQDARES